MGIGRDSDENRTGIGRDGTGPACAGAAATRAVTTDWAGGCGPGPQAALRRRARGAQQARSHGADSARSRSEQVAASRTAFRATTVVESTTVAAAFRAGPAAAEYPISGKNPISPGMATVTIHGPGGWWVGPVTVGAAATAAV
jgi:hypothetical protein